VTSELSENRSAGVVANNGWAAIELCGKAIRAQDWTGPEGSRRLRLPDLKTFGT